MHRTTGPGNVAGAFVDEVPGSVTGTTVEEDWLNTAQEELVNVIEDEGDTLSSGNDHQIFQTIAKRIAQRGKKLGELFFMDEYIAPSEWNPATPDDYWAGVCLDAGDQDLAVANWPDLVPRLLARKATYAEGIGGEKTAFDVTEWEVSTNVATLAFADVAAEIGVLTGLSEDNLVHGDFTSWRSITLAGAIGNIPAGTYAITGIDATARTVTFDVTASNGTGSVTETVEFFIHKIAGSSSARIFERPAGVLVAANDDAGDGIAGLRRRDRFQGHWHAGFGTTTGGNIPDPTLFAMAEANVDRFGASTPIADPDNGDPRYGATTDPRAIIGHLYIWAVEYIA